MAIHTWQSRVTRGEPGLTTLTSVCSLASRTACSTQQSRAMATVRQLLSSGRPRAVRTTTHRALQVFGTSTLRLLMIGGKPGGLRTRRQTIQSSVAEYATTEHVAISSTSLEQISTRTEGWLSVMTMVASVADVLRAISRMDSRPETTSQRRPQFHGSLEANACLQPMIHQLGQRLSRLPIHCRAKRECRMTAMSPAIPSGMRAIHC